jgi:hypothetical protein
VKSVETPAEEPREAQAKKSDMKTEFVLFEINGSNVMHAFKNLLDTGGASTVAPVSRPSALWRPQHGPRRRS